MQGSGCGCPCSSSSTRAPCLAARTLIPPTAASLAVTGGWDHCLRVVDARSGAVLSRLAWHATSVYAAAAAIAAAPVQTGEEHPFIEYDTIAASDDPFEPLPGAAQLDVGAGADADAATLANAVSTSRYESGVGGTATAYCIASAGKDGRIALWGLAVS